MIQAIPPHPDSIAECVLSTFRSLAPKYKPRLLGPNGRREWVPLAGIVASRTGRHTAADVCWARSDTAKLTCLSLSTGMKCLPRDKLGSARGNVLHDWHAEVLALRGLNRFLLDACLRDDPNWLTATITTTTGGTTAGMNGGSGSGSGSGSGTGGRKWKLVEEVEGLYMYCSEAPCGDVSMELVMAEQEDATPWAVGGEGEGLAGRGGFGRLGVVRRKPARGDAPVCLSKSCSDKLAMKQVLGVVGGLVSLLVEGNERFWLRAVVLPEDRCVEEAIERAWGSQGRMKGCKVPEGNAGYGYRPFEVWTTSKRFEYDKTEDTVASNLAVVWTPQRQEILINGVLQGRKQQDPKGRSSTSRRSMWEDVKALNVPELQESMGFSTYSDLEASSMLKDREAAKRDARTSSLQGWERNTGDEQWGIT